MKHGCTADPPKPSPVDSLIVTRRNRVAEICRDPALVAANAESLRRACREYIDDGGFRATQKVSGIKTKKRARR